MPPPFPLTVPLPHIIVRAVDNVNPPDTPTPDAKPNSKTVYIAVACAVVVTVFGAAVVFFILHRRHAQRRQLTAIPRTTSTLCLTKVNSATERELENSRREWEDRMRNYPKSEEGIWHNGHPASQTQQSQAQQSQAQQPQTPWKPQLLQRLSMDDDQAVGHSRKMQEKLKKKLTERRSMNESRPTAGARDLTPARNLSDPRNRPFESGSSRVRRPPASATLHRRLPDIRESSTPPTLSRTMTDSEIMTQSEERARVESQNALKQLFLNGQGDSIVDRSSPRVSRPIAETSKKDSGKKSFKKKLQRIRN